MKTFCKKPSRLFQCADSILLRDHHHWTGLAVGDWRSLVIIVVIEPMEVVPGEPDANRLPAALQLGEKLESYGVKRRRPGVRPAFWLHEQESYLASLSLGFLSDRMGLMVFDLHHCEKSELLRVKMPSTGPGVQERRLFIPELRLSILNPTLLVYCLGHVTSPSLSFFPCKMGRNTWYRVFECLACGLAQSGYSKVVACFSFFLLSFPPFILLPRCLW